MVGETSDGAELVASVLEKSKSASRASGEKEEAGLR